MAVLTLSILRQQVQQTQLRLIVRKLNSQTLNDEQTDVWLSKALQLIEQPHLLPIYFSCKQKNDWVNVGQSLLIHALEAPFSTEYLSKLGWARILRMGSEGIRQFFDPTQERGAFLLDQRLEESLSSYQGHQHSSILRLVTLNDFFPQLFQALKQGQFHPFSPMPLSEDLIQEDQNHGMVFSWRAQTQHSLIGYVAVHTHHAAYLRAFLSQGGTADDILIGDASLPQYQLTFLQHICQDVLAMSVGRPAYTIPQRVLPLSYTEKARLALECGANMHYAYGDRPSPLEWIEGALRYPDLKNPKPLEELMDIFESHQLRRTLQHHSLECDSNLESKQAKRL